jgi:hypothetical protein
MLLCQLNMFSVSSFDEYEYKCFVQDRVTSPLLNSHSYQSCLLLDESSRTYLPFVGYTTPLFSDRLAINARLSSSEGLRTGPFCHAEGLNFGEGGLSRKQFVFLSHLQLWLEIF